MTDPNEGDLNIPIPNKVKYFLDEVPTALWLSAVSEYNTFIHAQHAGSSYGQKPIVRATEIDGQSSGFDHHCLPTSG